MSQYCEQCGAPIPEGSGFCENCGAAVGTQPVAAKKENPVNKLINRFKTDKKFTLIVGGVAVVLVVAVILICVLSGGGGSSNSPAGAVENLMAVVYEGKSGKIEGLAPKEYWEYLEDEEDVDVDDLVDDYKDSWEDMEEELEDYFGDNVKITYEIGEEDELSSKKRKGIAEALEDQYDIDADSVTDAVEIEVELTIKGSDDKESMDETVTVVKIDGKWYPIYWYDYDDEYYVSFMVEDIF